MNLELKLLLITVIISVLLTSIFAPLSIPKKAQDLTDNLASTENSYLWSIYNSQIDPKIISNFNWYWDNLPESLQKSTPIAQNLSLKWPPQKGERFRMTAFPYPDTGKSKFWLAQFIKGMSSLLDNTSDQVTFPGWQISIYDPLNPNKNSWQKFLTEQIKWDPKLGALIHQNMKAKTNPFTPVYMEVIHSCYIPPSLDYPACDDGGYWLYGASGTGIFWQCGGFSWSNHEEGKILPGGGGCLVANNKIDAMFKLMETDIGMTILTSKDKTMTPLKLLVDRLKNGGGGYSLIGAMKTVIKAFHNKDQIPEIVAFRSMVPSSATKGWVTWIFFSVLFTVFILVFLGYCIRNIIMSFQHKRSIGSTILTIVAFIVSFFVVISLEWSVATELMLRNFGYMTLDMALKQSNMSLEEFILACAGRDKNNNYTDTYVPLANSLAQIQNFDFDLDTFCNINRLDSVIMHTQPNKSGSWAVEIMDVRNTPFKKDAKKLSDLVYSLGLCGRPVDKSVTDNMPQLRQGPLVQSPLYFGYQPDLSTDSSKCNCDENAVRQQYKDGGQLKKCLFCQGSISQQLC